MTHNLFITGGTGYMGQALIPLLAGRGHRIKALVRNGSERKLPHDAEAVIGDALQTNSYVDAVCGADTFIHLIGVPHPSPTKAAQFRSIDRVSAQVALHAARTAGVRHMVYLSVAQPAPIMRDYVAVRRECETLIGDSGLCATFLRPWYVLGPGHRWPYALLPLYWVLERVPATREGAMRMGLVTLDTMLNALVYAVEHPPHAVRVLDVPAMRALPRVSGDAQYASPL